MSALMERGGGVSGRRCSPFSSSPLCMVLMDSPLLPPLFSLLLLILLSSNGSYADLFLLLFPGFEKKKKKRKQRELHIRAKTGTDSWKRLEASFKKEKNQWLLGRTFPCTSRYTYSIFLYPILDFCCRLIEELSAVPLQTDHFAVTGLNAVHA